MTEYKPDPESIFLSKSLTPIDRQLNKKLVKIIHALLMMDESAAFRKPVAHKALGLEDYKLIVKKPTDLNLIRRQNNEGKYKYAEQIFDQIQLCWDNCKLYNAIGSEIYEQALFMEQAFDKIGKQILPQFWQGIDRQEINQRTLAKKIDQERHKKNHHKGSILKKQKVIQEKFELKNKLKPTNRRSISKEIQQEIVIPQTINVIEDDKKLKAKDSEKHIIDDENQNQGEGLNQKQSAEQNNGEQNIEQVVEPILINLLETPTYEQLFQLSEIIKSLYIKQQLGFIQKVVEVLHQNEKEHMSINKNGQMAFNMQKIHISTFYRIKKAIGLQQNYVIIE